MPVEKRKPKRPNDIKSTDDINNNLLRGKINEINTGSATIYTLEDAKKPYEYNPVIITT